MDRRIAFLFPGQGALPDSLPPVSDRIEELYALAKEHGLALRTWIEEGRRERLARTDAAQPAILIDSLAREAALREAGLRPALVAGHSLGEYAALVSARALTAADALRIVIERGRLMTEVDGAMAAIVKLDLETVSRLCADVGPEVVVANHNGPRQVVVSGARTAVDRVIELAGQAGGRGIPLEVSGPFHSPYMRRAEEALVAAIERTSFASPECPVVSGVSAAIETDSGRLKDLMLRQITSCVRWVEVIDRLVDSEIPVAVEAGSGTVLSGIGKRITEKITFMPYEEAIDGAL
jgi:[acyl-carrier-protein] S-malonyltransferase